MKSLVDDADTEVRHSVDERRIIVNAELATQWPWLERILAERMRPKRPVRVLTPLSVGRSADSLDSHPMLLPSILKLRGITLLLEMGGVLSTRAESVIEAIGLSDSHGWTIGCRSFGNEERRRVGRPVGRKRLSLEK